MIVKDEMLNKALVDNFFKKLEEDKVKINYDNENKLKYNTNEFMTAIVLKYYSEKLIKKFKLNKDDINFFVEKMHEYHKEN